MATMQVNTADVQIGMYVTRLDRPWLGTPYDLEGFQIREEAEIENLQSRCKHVFILMPDEEIEISAPRTSRTWMSSKEKAHRGYKVTSDVREELPAAQDSHTEISTLITDIADTVRQEQKLDIPRLETAVDVMVSSIERNPDAYTWLTRIKDFDSFAYRQSLSASVWATTFGCHLELDEGALRDLALGALLMDIGNTSLPAELVKKEGQLSSEEWQMVRSHVGLSTQILSKTPGISEKVIEMVRSHHERLDGSGYPEGRRGSSIPQSAQIAGIVDFYSTTTIPRPHGKSISPGQALQMLERQRGRYFDEKLVDVFVQALSTYPTGSLVELTTGEVGIVTAQNPGWRLQPRLVLLLDPDKKPYGSYPRINLFDEADNKEASPRHIRRTLPENSYGLRIEELHF